MRYSVGQKGQIVIAKDIRDRLGVGPGWLAVQRLVEDHLEIYFVPPAHRESLKGSLEKHIKASVPDGREWDEAREIAWGQAAGSKVRPREMP